jgi:hypothetical protein
MSSYELLSTTYASKLIIILVNKQRNRLKELGNSNSDKNGKQIVPLIVCSLIHTIYKPDAIGLENVRGRVIDFVT